MPSLETTYLGLTLKNPIIVSSSDFTASVDKVVECAEAGAGAVVLKSIFEEALAKVDWGLGETVESHPEAYDYFQAHLELQYGPKEYCEFITDVKKRVDIPVIASVNCLSDKLWPSYAVQLEKAGADALELNVFLPAYDAAVAGEALEEIYLSIIKQVKSVVSIPVSIKIDSHFTSLPNFAFRLAEAGCDGLVLFNRFVELDIDIDKLEPISTFSYSSSHDALHVLRWTAVLSKAFSHDISATTGVHTSEDIVKLLLAGASTVQAASLFYQDGLGRIADLLGGVEKWMDSHGFADIASFKGKISMAADDRPDRFLRAQFVDKIAGGSQAK